MDDIKGKITVGVISASRLFRDALFKIVRPCVYITLSASSFDPFDNVHASRHLDLVILDAHDVSHSLLLAWRDRSRSTKLILVGAETTRLNFADCIRLGVVGY